MKISEAADKAIEKLNQGWTKGVTARDADGIVEFPWSERAVSWCAIGAINSITSERSYELPNSHWSNELRRRVNKKALDVMGFASREEMVSKTFAKLDSVAYFNDRVAEDKSEVIALFEKVRAEALERGE